MDRNLQTVDSSISSSAETLHVVEDTMTPEELKNEVVRWIQITNRKLKLNQKLDTYFPESPIFAGAHEFEDHYFVDDEQPTNTAWSERNLLCNGKQDVQSLLQDNREESKSRRSFTLSRKRHLLDAFADKATDDEAKFQTHAGTSNSARQSPGMSKIINLGRKEMPYDTEQASTVECHKDDLFTALGKTIFCLLTKEETDTSINNICALMKDLKSDINKAHKECERESARLVRKQEYGNKGIQTVNMENITRHLENLYEIEICETCKQTSTEDLEDFCSYTEELGAGLTTGRFKSEYKPNSTETVELEGKPVEEPFDYCAPLIPSVAMSRHANGSECVPKCKMVCECYILKQEPENPHTSLLSGYSGASTQGLHMSNAKLRVGSQPPNEKCSIPIRQSQNLDASRTELKAPYTSTIHGSRNKLQNGMAVSNAKTSFTCMPSQASSRSEVQSGMSPSYTRPSNAYMSRQASSRSEVQNGMSPSYTRPSNAYMSRQASSRSEVQNGMSPSYTRPSNACMPSHASSRIEVQNGMSPSYTRPSNAYMSGQATSRNKLPNGKGSSCSCYTKSPSPHQFRQAP